ncbi:MAG: Cof-type HAD-IIB family hydrolase [Erysipelotrichaceae bacterium]|nr:Cof-type HAD-IIB family hydrolase [Erysipelotrichaceae bacterium]
MIKAIFFDVDGTLLSHTLKKIPDSTRKSIDLLQKKGIKVYLSTGRHLNELKELPILDIKFDGYICLNGQMVLDSHHELLFGSAMRDEMEEKMVELFNRKEIPFILVTEKELYMNFVNDLVVAVQKEISSSIPEVHEYDGKPIYMATAYLMKDKEDSLINELPEGLKLVRWQPKAADIIMEGDGKVEGIKKILEYLSITKEEIMAFGDAGNDITMLEFAGMGVAMGNADEETKSHADYVTDHIDNDGVEKALIHFGLLDK